MKFTMNRDRTIASTMGLAIEFKKGVATHVPPSMYAEVSAAGAVPEDDIQEDEAKAMPEPAGEAREKLIMDEMARVIGRNSREDFTAGGAPKASVLSASLKFSVSDKERNAALLKLQNASTEK